MESCRSNKDCSSSETCLNSKCETNSNTSNGKLSTGAYVGIGIGVVVFIGIIVAICLRANRSSRKGAYNKSLESHSARQPEQGPAPLPLGYKKPVDLLQVAEQNRRMEEAEERKRIQEQENVIYTANYQSNPTNGPYVTVPLNQLYVVTQNAPNVQNIPGSVPIYMTPRQQSSNYGYTGSIYDLTKVMPQQSHGQSRSSDGSPVSNVNTTGQSPDMDINNNYLSGQYMSYSKTMAYPQPVPPPRSNSPQRFASNASHSSSGSNINGSYRNTGGISPVHAPERNSSVRNIKDLPTLPNANH